MTASTTDSFTPALRRRSKPTQRVRSAVARQVPDLMCESDLKHSARRSESFVHRIAKLVSSAVRTCCVLLALGLLLAEAHAVDRGAILVLSQSGPTYTKGALLLVDPTSGQRRLLSDFADASQGPLGEAPATITVDREGRVFVSDLFGPATAGGRIFEIDRQSGHRRIAADLASNGVASFYSYGLAASRRGVLFGAAEFAYVFASDPDTGQQRLVSSVANPAQWTPGGFRQIIELTVDHEGAVIVASNDFAAALGSTIHRVDPSTGVATLLSDFADASQGADVGEFWFATGMAIGRSGEILVNSGYTAAAPRPLLFRIDPRTGKRRVLSDFDRADQGPTGATLYGMAIERDGSIVVSAGDPVTGASDPPRLVRVNAVSGRRTLLSDGADPSQGPLLTGVTSVVFLEGRKPDAP